MRYYIDYEEVEKEYFIRILEQCLNETIVDHSEYFKNMVRDREIHFSSDLKNETIIKYYENMVMDLILLALQTRKVVIVQALRFSIE